MIPLLLWTISAVINWAVMFRMFYIFKKEMGFINYYGAAFLLFWVTILGPIGTVIGAIMAFPEKETYDTSRKFSKAE